MRDTKRPHRRRAARELALQALYQLHMNGDIAINVEAQFLTHQDFKHADKRLFSKILRGVSQQVAELDTMVAAHIDRELSELDPIERNILRMGAFELSDSVAVPYRVVINECVELGKVFGATDGHKYVNGILHKLAAQYRQIEVNENKH